MMVSRRREAGHLPVARHVDLLPTFVFPIIDVLKWGTILWQDNRRAFAADVHVVGIIAVTISGWLGGELVYKHGVAVNPQNDSRGEEAAKARIS